MKRMFLCVVAACVLALPSAVSAQPFTITFAGDYGANERTRTVLQRITSIAPEAHFALGDLSYAQLPEPQWCDLVHSYVKTPFLLVPGNHESNGENGNIVNFAKCLPYNYGAPMHGEYPHEYYVDMPAGKPLARFIMISPNLPFSDGRSFEYRANTEHMQWLKQAIDDGRKQGLKWIIVGMHKVCVTTETKSCEVGEELMNMLTQQKVDVVLMGHVHAYERSHQLSCMAAGMFKPECALVAKDNMYRQGRGTLFITAGMGGMPLRALTPQDSERGYFAELFGKAEGNHAGVGVLTITEQSLRHEFVEAVTGTVLDSFVLQAPPF